MFKKNTAVTGFGIGHFIGVADGIAVTTGTPTCKRTLDGTGGACANAAAYNTDGAVWTIDLTAGDMNADVVVLSFTLAGCIPISYTIKTVTKLVSELVDAAAAPSASDNATATAAAILVTPANKLATLATGEAAANVIRWDSSFVAPADVNGNVPALLCETQSSVTFGQIKIRASVDGQGAIDVLNAGLTGIGIYVEGQTGQKNVGTNTGVYNYGGSYGQVNEGPGEAGAYNTGAYAVSGVDSWGIRNAIGMADPNMDIQLAAVAKTGADGDTLKTLSDQIDGVGGVSQQDIADALLLAPVGVAAAGSAMAELAAILEDTGTTLPALIVPNVGARTVVITVNDGTDPLENAKVRLTEGINTVVETTDVNGNVTFNRDDATYLVAITKAGYTFSGTSLVVNGDETQTYSMITVSFAVSDPGQATGWVYCYDDEGNVEAGVSISVQLTATPETDSYAFDTVVRVVSSEVDGLAEFTGLWIGATYRARRFNGPWYSFVVPNVSTFALPVLLGR